MSQAATADHGNQQAAGRDYRCQNERGFIAHSAGRVLVDFFAGKFGEIQNLSRVQHGGRQGRRFGPRQSSQDGSHQPCRCLVIRDLGFRVTTNEEFDLAPRKFVAIAFFADDVNGTKAGRRRAGGLSIHFRRNPSGRSSVICACFQP